MKPKQKKIGKLSNRKIVKLQAKKIIQLGNAVYDFQVAKQKAESNANDYFAALIVKSEKCRKLEERLENEREITRMIKVKLAHANLPFWKRWFIND